MNVPTKACPACGALADASVPACPACGRIYTPAPPRPRESLLRRVVFAPFHAWSRRDRWDIGLCFVELSIVLGVLLWVYVLPKGRASSMPGVDRLRGKIALHMTARQVRAALGEPGRIERAEALDGVREFWRYPVGDNFLELELRAQRVVGIEEH